MVAILLFITILLFVVIDAWVHRGKSVTAQQSGTPVEVAGDGRAESAGYRPVAAPSRFADGIFLAEGHTWLLLEESGTVKTGLDDFARTIIGDVDGVVTRTVGEPVRKGEVILKVHHGKRTASFRAALDGVIEAVNVEHLQAGKANTSGRLSTDWVYRIKPDDISSTLAGLHIGRKAREWLERETRRIKVLLATVEPEHRQLGEMLQDGGTLVWGLIDYMNDDEWKQVRDKMLG
jgi:glycine cleavage system H lipoate-binding protein